MNKKKHSPAAIAGMALAAFAGVGFAVWNISRSLNPPTPEPADPLLESAAPQNSAQTNAGSDSAAAPSRENNPQTAAAVRPDSDESRLAPTADPFQPLGVTALTQQAPVQTAPSTAAAPVAERQLPTYGIGLSQANSYPQTGGYSLGTSPARVTVAIPDPPDLVGTLLGDTPSAVFRSKDGVVVVAMGEKFGGWKVARVVHGGVVLTHGKKRVTVGTSMAGAVNAAREESLPAKGTPQMADSPIVEESPERDSPPDPFLVAEAVNPAGAVSSPISAPSGTNPLPSPAPTEETPAPAPPVVEESVLPPKPDGVKEEPKKENPR